MGRPQPAPALRKSRPESHAFEQAAAATTAAAEPVSAPEASAPAPVPSVPGGTSQRRTAATTARRNGSQEASHTENEGPLAKLSVRVPPARHRHIRLYLAEHGLSFQQIAMTALEEYFDRQGRPLPAPAGE